MGGTPYPGMKLKNLYNYIKGMVKKIFWVMKYDMYDIGLLGSWTYKRGLELAHHQEMTMHNHYGNDYNEILQGK